MAASGTTTLDFGSTPNQLSSVAVTGQTGILVGSLVEAWLLPIATANKTVEDQIAEPLRLVAGNIVPGVGFTIYGVLDQGVTTGQFNVAWVWL